MSKDSLSFYERRGASAIKEDVKKAIEGMDRGLFPGAFCKAVPDLLTGSNEHCIISHADGAGTKSALAYVHFRRHHDPGVFSGIAQDSLVMNLDDLLCVGATGPFVYSNTIGRNSKLIPHSIIRTIILGYEIFTAALRPLGIELIPCGGETADLGDLVRTVIADSSLMTRMERREFVDCGSVVAGHVIVGLASFGRSKYESKVNSGIGTNGFTALRHALFSHEYCREFPETYAPEIEGFAYVGKCHIDDPLPGSTMTLGEACLSPTRTYAPIVARALATCRSSISAMFHNTGGGQTKCVNFGCNVRYVKDNLFDAPPIFEFIRMNTEIPFREMLQTFNMGHRFEIVCDVAAATEIVKIAESFGVAAQVVGRVEAARGRSLVIETMGNTFEYGRD